MVRLIWRPCAGPFGTKCAQYGRTALIGAAMKGHADCARLLLEAGADTNAKANVRASAGDAYRVMMMDKCASERVICMSFFQVFITGFHLLLRRIESPRQM